MANTKATPPPKPVSDLHMPVHTGARYSAILANEKYTSFAMWRRFTPSLGRYIRKTQPPALTRPCWPDNIAWLEIRCLVVLSPICPCCYSLLVSSLNLTLSQHELTLSWAFPSLGTELLSNSRRWDFLLNAVYPSLTWDLHDKWNSCKGILFSIIFCFFFHLPITFWKFYFGWIFSKLFSA